MSSNFTTRIVTAPEPGGPDALRIKEISLAPPGDGEVLIKVSGAGINRPDVFERMGFYPPPPGAPEGLGLEVSGHVLAMGKHAAGRFKEGDPVVALVTGGGYADIAKAPQETVLPAPKGIDLLEAAGLPETVFTVWSNVFGRGALNPHETLLVHGGLSGIGTTAIQMAKAYGANVMATAGTDEKCELCRSLKADHVFNYKNEDWVAAIRDLGGVDVILDMVGGEYVQKNLSCLNADGRLVQIAFLQGSKVEIDLMGMMLKRQTITGSTLRARDLQFKKSISHAVQETVWPWIAGGQFKPVIDQVFDLDDVSQAHTRMDSGLHSGKILLRP